MSDGFKRVKTIFNAEPGKTSLDIPKQPKKQFVSALGKGSKALTDTVKQGSIVARKTLHASVSSAKNAGKFVGLSKKKSSDDSKTEDQILEEKIHQLFNGQETLFERLESEPKLSAAMRKSIASIKHTTRSSVSYAKKQPLVAKVAVIVLVSVLSGVFSAISNSGTDDIAQNKVNEVAGASTVSTSEAENNEDIKTNKPSFSVVTPKGKDVNGVERKAPSGDKLYSFADDIGGVGVTVTQQQLPESFLKESSTKLADIAKANYFANVIQIDNITVYHGTSEKNKQQSAVLVKNGNLIFLEISQKVSDETLTAYILSLQ